MGTSGSSSKNTSNNEAGTAKKTETVNSVKEDTVQLEILKLFQQMKEDM